jgi:predicted DNA-binding transcriptional regulator AlpA
MLQKLGVNRDLGLKNMANHEVKNNFEPTLVTAKEVASILQVSIRTLWRLRSARQLPSPIRIGNAVRWRIEEIRNWIARDCPVSNAVQSGRRVSS